MFDVRQGHVDEVKQRCKAKEEKRIFKRLRSSVTWCSLELKLNDSIWKKKYFLCGTEKWKRSAGTVGEGTFILLIQAALVFSSLYYYWAHFSAHSIFLEWSCKPFFCFLRNKTLQNIYVYKERISCGRCKWNLKYSI